MRKVLVVIVVAAIVLGASVNASAVVKIVDPCGRLAMWIRPGRRTGQRRSCEPRRKPLIGAKPRKRCRTERYQRSPGRAGHRLT